MLAFSPVNPSFVSFIHTSNKWNLRWQKEDFPSLIRDINVDKNSMSGFYSDAIIKMRKWPSGKTTQKKLFEAFNIQNMI